MTKAPKTAGFNEDRKGEFKSIGGSQSDNWNNMLARQAVQAMCLEHSDEETTNQQMSAAVAALQGIGPRDELEGMMAGQLFAAHSATMECFRRAMIPGQPPAIRNQNLNQANKLVRASAALLNALNKHRGKGQQKVRVEHVHVHDGGQAVVGSVEMPRSGGTE